jgi:tetratricopeptide (TPR) repeat protein
MLIRRCSVAMLASLGFALSAPSYSADPISACSPMIGRIVSLQGKIEVRRAGTGPWHAVSQLDFPLCPGDVLHTGTRSRSAIVLAPETLVRVDQNSTMLLRPEGAEIHVEMFKDDQVPPSVVGNACGAGYFITRFPKKFKVYTPYLNAAVEGTEFQVALACDRAELSVFEGRVSAESLVSQVARLVLTSGQVTSAGPGEEPAPIKALIRPTDAVQWALYYPPTSEAAAGDIPADCAGLAPSERSVCLTTRTEGLLRAGRVDEAQEQIKALTELVPLSADAQALSSVIAVVKNDKAEALKLAQRAVELSEQSSRAWLALSYAQQAHFELEKALGAAKRAAALAPGSALIQARVAELLMSLGDTKAAEKTAQAAVKANPKESRAHTVLGFVHLAQIDTKQAKQDFIQAIELDSTDPLPRLGNGLAIIREGKLEEGREQIEIAVALDPTNSLIRSYVGKAHYEENTKERDTLAASQFDIAKELDPKDPTPHFYDAILKQTQNRPVEALEELQSSIEKNDNRAVYRSRLLLDDDLATRNVSVVRIHHDLGFGQSALVEGWKSLSIDPTNYSAHRLLADTYAVLPRHEVARVSELLQAQLWQPLNLSPLQPQLVDGKPFTLAGAGPNPGQNEYSELFTRNGASAQLYGIGGGQSTDGGQLVASGINDKVMFSFGHLYYNTEFFRANTDLEKDIVDVVIQYEPVYRTNVQMELRRIENRRGDLSFRFDPANFFDFQTHDETELLRLGGRHSLNERHSFLVSGVVQSRTEQIDFSGFRIFNAVADSGMGELQYVFRHPSVGLVLGGGYFEGTLRGDLSLVGAAPKNMLRGDNFYGYATFNLPSARLQTQIGLSQDSLAGPDVGPSRESTNPKVGLVWGATQDTLVRIAWFRALKRRLLADQTIEPTQVAGFSQFYDDFNGTQSRRVGIGIDQRFGPLLFAGFELSSRNLKVPQSFTDFVYDWHEKAHRAYIHWAPSNSLALAAEYSYERFDRPPEFPGTEQIFRVETHRVPLSLNWRPFHNWSARVIPSYVHQSGEFLDAAQTPLRGKESFWITELSISYQLPRRHGMVSLEVKNLFDENFRFQETNFVSPTMSRGRLILGRFALRI